MNGILYFTKSDLQSIIRKHLEETYLLKPHMSKWVSYTPEQMFTRPYSMSTGYNVEIPVQFNVIVDGVTYDDVDVTAQFPLN